jgi:hypothetical protein
MVIAKILEHIAGGSGFLRRAGRLIFHVAHDRAGDELAHADAERKAATKVVP